MDKMVAKFEIIVKAEIYGMIVGKKEEKETCSKADT